MKLHVGKCLLCSSTGLSPCTQHLKIPPQQKHWTLSPGPRKKKPALASSPDVTGASVGQLSKVRSRSPSLRIWGSSRMCSIVLLSSVILWHGGFPFSCLVPVIPFAVHSGARTEGECSTLTEIIWSAVGACTLAYRRLLSRKATECQNVCSLMLEWMTAWMLLCLLGKMAHHVNNFRGLLKPYNYRRYHMRAHTY